MSQLSYSSNFENMLRQALKENIYEEADAIPSEAELAKAMSISKQHERRMRKLCRIEDRREKWGVFAEPARRVAAIIIAVMVLFSGLMMNSDIRAAVADLIIEWHERFTRFVSSPTSEAEGMVDDVTWRPTYIPEGYEEIGASGEIFIDINYENEDGKTITFGCSINGVQISVDNENKITYIEELEGITYHVFESELVDEPHIVVWTKEGYTFDVIGYGDIKEILKMCQSVKAD